MVQEQQHYPKDWMQMRRLHPMDLQEQELALELTAELKLAQVLDHPRDWLVVREWVLALTLVPEPELVQELAAREALERSSLRL